MGNYSVVKEPDHCSIQRSVTPYIRITYLDLYLIFLVPAILHCC
jgi:hypothetical protein